MRVVGVLSPVTPINASFRVFGRAFQARALAIGTRVIVTVIALLFAAPASAVDATAAATQVAVRFLTSYQALQWDAAAELVHQQSLVRLRRAVRPFVESAAATGQLQRQLGIRTVQEFDAWTNQEVYARLQARIDARRPHSRATAHAPAIRIVGAVIDGSEICHVLYAQRAAESENEDELIRVLTLRREGDQWRIVSGSLMRTIPAIFSNSGAPRP